MAQIINLRTHKKKIARAEKEKQAEENRKKFGQKKSDKTLKKSLNALEERKLDQGKIERVDFTKNPASDDET